LLLLLRRVIVMRESKMTWRLLGNTLLRQTLHNQNGCFRCGGKASQANDSEASSVETNALYSWIFMFEDMIYYSWLNKNI
jgi:hypothetical protein